MTNGPKVAEFDPKSANLPKQVGRWPVDAGGVSVFALGDHRDLQTGDVLYRQPLVTNWVGPVLLEESPAQ